MINFIKKISLKYKIDMVGCSKFSAIEPYLIPCRLTSLLPRKPKTIITMLFPYFLNIAKHNVSRYAIINDYHIVCGEILHCISSELKIHFPEFNFAPFIDNSPIPEIRCAILCGLGCLGDNNLLINKKYGSWVFIGEIVTNMDMKSTSHYSECIHCGKCREKCPGKSLDTQELNKLTCVSNISQKKGTLSDNEIKILKRGDSIWGCDICQECCPLNIYPARSRIPSFQMNIHPIIGHGDYIRLDQRAFHWRSENVIERNIKLLN